jgi:GNAT superfamily N-acetyltransferase
VRAAVEIQLLSPEAGEDARLVEQVVDLVNEVYAAAEEGLWIDGAARVTSAQLGEQMQAGEIAVADLEGRIVGAVRIQRLSDTTGEFGMLAAHPAHRGIGVGRRLLGFAEETARAQGLSTMQLELLVPRDWTHPVKAFLAGWYTRIGYRLARTGTIDEAYPELVPLLATPCDFQIYLKDL